MDKGLMDLLGPARPGKGRMSVLFALARGMRSASMRALPARQAAFVRDKVTVRKVDRVRELPVPRRTARKLRSHA